MSKRLATAVTDVPVEDIDLEHTVSNPPDRSRLREVFREFELRDPLRRIEEALAEDGEAEVPRSRSEITIEVTATEVPSSELERLDGELAALAAERPGAPEEEVEGEAVPAHTGALRFAASRNVRDVFRLAGIGDVHDGRAVVLHLAGEQIRHRARVVPDVGNVAIALLLDDRLVRAPRLQIV